MYDLGLTKWVPLNVDKKLYSATLLVMLIAVSLGYLSPRKRLSSPRATSNTCLGAMRGGFLSSFSAPGAGMFTRVEPYSEGAQVVRGEDNVG